MMGKRKRMAHARVKAAFKDEIKGYRAIQRIEHAVGWAYAQGQDLLDSDEGREAMALVVQTLAIDDVVACHYWRVLISPSASSERACAWRSTVRTVRNILAWMEKKKRREQVGAIMSGLRQTI